MVKNRGIENARDSFEEVKKAYNKLCDEDQRQTVVLNIEAVQQQTKEERKTAGKKVAELTTFEEDLGTCGLLRHICTSRCLLFM